MCSSDLDEVQVRLARGLSNNNNENEGVVKKKKKGTRGGKKKAHCFSLNPAEPSQFCSFFFISEKTNEPMSVVPIWGF